MEKRNSVCQMTADLQRQQRLKAGARGVGFCAQYWRLQRRELRLLLRGWEDLAIAFLTAALLGFLIGASHLDIARARATMHYQLASLFMAAVTTTMLCFGNLPLLINDRMVFLNERAEGLYQTIPYMLVKLAVRFALGIVQVLSLSLGLRCPHVMPMHTNSWMVSNAYPGHSTVCWPFEGFTALVRRP